MKVYRIRDWAQHFENNRTRELKHLEWVPVPNRHDGDGFTELMDHPDAMSHYGAWHLILQVASKCDPRGTLLRDGAGGVKTPHTARSLARITRGDESVFTAAIERLLTIGWIECYDDPALACDIPAPRCGKVPMEWNGMEGNRNEGNGREQDALPADSILRMVRSIRTSRPEFSKLSEQVLEATISLCPKACRVQVVKDFTENASNMIECPKNPIGLLKAYIRKASESVAPDVEETIEQKRERLERKFR